MERKDYTERLKYTFAFYGFVVAPMSAREIHYCHKAGVSLDDAYKIGCDRNAGFRFKESFLANVKE